MPQIPQFSSETPPQPAEAQLSGSPVSFWQTTRGAILLAILSGLAIFAISVAADLLILHNHELTPRFTVEVSDAISATVIAGLSYKIIRMQQQRRATLRNRIEVIADMNHHVRNALQVISLSTQGRSKEELSVIRESMNRIQWALRELLPKI